MDVRAFRHLAVAALVAAGCSSEPAPAPPAERHTYRAIAGFSMGAMGATFLGARHPERFDAIGSLGGPMDFGYLLSYMERQHLGGFCTLGELERILAENQGDPAILDDPDALPCMTPAAARFATVLPEHEQAFDGWVFTRNGGAFDRDAYLDLFFDLALAFGNPLYFNPDSPLLPPGVERADLERGAALCDDPVVLEGFYNAEYNPEGAYPVISFCDGEEPVWYCRDSGRPMDWCASSDPAAFCAAEGGAEKAGSDRNPALWLSKMGRIEPCYRHTRPMGIALAVDLDRDGRRDYGEPIVVNAHERFEDVGADGCPDEREDGRGGCLAAATASGVDPNGDAYSWDLNPRGTEGNLRRDEGEPFGDHGLDGVPGTGDHGEGDKLYTETPGRRRYWEFDGRTLVRESWTEAERARVGFWLDGGIRDLFNFGVSSALLWGELAALDRATTGSFVGLADFPGSPLDEEDLDPLSVDFLSQPKNILFLYGDPAATPSELSQGDGDHVGTSRQLINRLFLHLRWLSARWSALPDPPGDKSNFHTRAKSLTFHSDALGAARDFGVLLPSGYDDPRNAGQRYPVLYLLHGYGMKPSGPGGFLESALLFDGAMASGRLRKMIVVYASGRCCYDDPATGERFCTEYDEAGNARSSDDSLVRECRSGTFYVDRNGFGDGDSTPYGASFFELMDHVDATFRTLPPVSP